MVLCVRMLSGVCLSNVRPVSPEMFGIEFNIHQTSTSADLLLPRFVVMLCLFVLVWRSGIPSAIYLHFVCIEERRLDC